jgi:hypothetical protein
MWNDNGGVSKVYLECNERPRYFYKEESIRHPVPYVSLKGGLTGDRRNAYIHWE